MSSATSVRLRTVVKRVTLPAILGLVFVAGAAAQDVEYVRAVERAQRQRPAEISNSARIAPAGTLGTPLVLRGRIVKQDGRLLMARSCSPITRIAPASMIAESEEHTHGL